MSRRALLSLILAMAIVAPVLLFASHQTSAVQETDPDIVTALNMINTYRDWLGIEPLTIEPNLQRAAEGHANYYKLNYGDPNLAGMGLHRQTEGKPGFTGASMSDRARAAGYSGSINENIGLSGSMIWSTDWFIATINHRLTLIDPRYTHVGMARVNEGNIKFEVIKLGAPSWASEFEPNWIAWPPDTTTGVGLSFHGEAPSPFAGAVYPTGYPITLSYRGSGALVIDSATMTSGGQVVDSFHSVGSGWLSSNTAQIAASKPLSTATTYEVAVTGTANGNPFTRTWTFTTTTGSDKLDLPGHVPTQPSPVPTPTVEPVNEPVEPSAPVDPTTEPTSTGPTEPDTASTPPVRVIANPPGNLPPGVTAAPVDIQEIWWLADGPVAEDLVKRSWLWGPDSWIAVSERYDEEPDRARMVYYFDKARVEVNIGELHEGLTAGLLVRDMILGSVQVGEETFLPREPAQVALAGDGIEWNEGAPTYASLHSVASIEEGREVAPRPGLDIVETLGADGIIGTDEALAGHARYASYDETLGHNIADVFDSYLSDLAIDRHMSVGLPLSEPYWVMTLVNQEPTWVLVQAFERRLLTFTPTNDPDWQVEMGNVGRHYYEWRYEAEAPSVYAEPAG
jgi:hypothetical protein